MNEHSAVLLEPTSRSPARLEFATSSLRRWSLWAFTTLKVKGRRRGGPNHIDCIMSRAGAVLEPSPPKTHRRPVFVIEPKPEIPRFITESSANSGVGFCRN
jgi:hypothetical protein